MAHGGHLRCLQPQRNPKSMDIYKAFSRATYTTVVQTQTGKTGPNDLVDSVGRAEMAIFNGHT